MDEFLTGIEAEFRGRAAEYFRERIATGGTPMMAEEAWRDLSGLRDRSTPAAGGLTLRLLMLDEAARRDPRLGHDLLAGSSALTSSGRVEAVAGRLAEAAGSAAHVLEAGARAAREQGFFSSSLMGFREVQERLAGLASGAELARLGACRLCRLLEKGEEARAALETEGLAARAAALTAEVRAAAGLLLGPAWVEERLPAAEGPLSDERTRS